MLRVLSCRPLALERWLEIDAHHPAPIFSARPAWSLAWAKTFPDYRPYPITCSLSSGQKVFVPLLLSKGRWGWRLCTGMPWSECTMFLQPDGAEADQEVALAACSAVATRCCDALEVTLWPLGSTPSLPLRGRRRVGEISVIDLADGAEAVMSRMDGKARRMAGQAERRGVTCARAEGQEAPALYYKMLEASAKRWGLIEPTISRAHLQNVMKYGGMDAEIWFAYFQGRPIAGGVVLFGSREMYFWSAAMYAEFSTLRPSNALNVALIKHACERGVQWYNLSSSSGLTGVERFKEGLGAKRVRYTTLTAERGVYAAYRALRATITRR